MSESIYHLIKEVIPPAPKQPMYHSKHDPLAKPYAAASTFSAAASKKEFGSIGREVKAQVARPLVYTKAHERSGPLSGTASTILRECWSGRTLLAVATGHPTSLGLSACDVVDECLRSGPDGFPHGAHCQALLVGRPRCLFAQA